MPTYKLTLEYDGTAYAGWQRQPDQPTIQATLEAVLETITQMPTSTIAAGRTDAGVHALGQVVSFRSDKALSLREWTRACNGLLPADISITAIERAADDFHARYHACSKVYEYRILHRVERSALERNRSWHIPASLEVAAMCEAATYLTGRYDFSSFQGLQTDTEDPICDLQRLEITQEGPSIRMTVQADRFLKQMVRALVGTLVEVGRGKRAPSSLQQVLKAKDRRAAGKTAPPHGLYLVKVMYDTDAYKRKTGEAEFC